MLFVRDDIRYAFLLAGFIFFGIMFARYRNADARHTYEKDTKKEMNNLQKVDKFIKSKKGLTSATMDCANNKIVKGTKLGNSMVNNNFANDAVNSIINNNVVASFIKDNIKKKDRK